MIASGAITREHQPVRKLAIDASPGKPSHPAGVALDKATECFSGVKVDATRLIDSFVHLEFQIRSSCLPDNAHVLVEHDAAWANIEGLLELRHIGERSVHAI